MTCHVSVWEWRFHANFPIPTWYNYILKCIPVWMPETMWWPMAITSGQSQFPAKFYSPGPGPEMRNPTLRPNIRSTTFYRLSYGTGTPCYTSENIINIQDCSAVNHIHSDPRAPKLLREKWVCRVDVSSYQCRPQAMDSYTCWESAPSWLRELFI